MQPVNSDGRDGQGGDEHRHGPKQGEHLAQQWSRIPRPETLNVMNTLLSEGVKTNLYLISVKVSGIVTKHCHRSETARFAIRRFLKYFSSIFYSHVYPKLDTSLAFLKFGLNMTAPITRIFSMEPPGHQRNMVMHGYVPWWFKNFLPIIKIQ